MRKLLLLILTLFIANMAVMADRVSEAEALQKAQQFMQGKKFKMDGKRRAISPQQQQPAYYVFNAESDGGFVIVAGDDRMPDILGYSEKGNINMRNIPCNMEWLMNCYTQTLDSLNAYGITHKWSSRRSNNFATIEPLIMTTWGQHAPYNKYCPEIEGEKCPTGCVATAMAQIINYKKWPQGETTAVDAYTTHSGISMPALEPTTFDWSNMTDDDIARLMLYCGQAARMNYLLSGSGTGEPSEALKSVFGYSNSTKSWLIKIFESEHLIETVYNELADDRPVFYTGYSKTNNDGHAFVVDGYKDGMFHINWGWNGDADGYFDITGLTEDVMPFLPTWETEMVVGIEPPAPNSEQAKVIVSEFQSGYRNSYRTNASEDFLFPVSFHGLFSCDYDASCYIGLGLYHDNELVKVIASQLVSFPMDDFLYFNNVYIEKDISQGTYTLCPVYRHGEAEEWRKTIGSNQNCMIAHVSDKTCYFEFFVDEWDGHYQDYGYKEINGVTYGLTFQFNTNWAYVLPYQLTGKYSGDIVIPNKFVYDGKEFFVREERESPFVGCSDLYSLSAAIDQSIMLSGCTNLTQLNLQQGHYISIINCPKLESIEFPVTTQSASVNWCQNLKTMKFTNVVPYGIPSLGESDFPSLTDVYFASAVPPEVPGYEDEIPNNPHVTIHVPKGSTIVYQNSQWKQWNIVDDYIEVSLVKWGYCHSDRVGPLGMAQGTKGEDIDQELAMRIAPEDLVAYIGSKITHIEVFSESRSLNDWGYEDYEYVFITKRGTDYLVKQPFQVVRGAWNSIKLDEPYTITGEELFVGIGRRGQLGIQFSDDTFVPDAAWERFMGEGSSPYTELGKWEYSKDCGLLDGPSEKFAHPLPLRFAIEGDNVPEGVVLRELEVEGAGYGAPILTPSRRSSETSITINGVIRNRSLESVTSYTVEWSIDGGEKHSKTIQTMLAPNATENITLEIPAITTAGTHLIATNVTMVNENANQLEGLNMPTIEYIVSGTFKLTYMVDNVEYKSYDIEYGATITPEPAPTKEGYTFSGWSTIPETMPAHDVTISGTFIINKYKLTYIVDGVEYKSYDIEYGATITPEAEPTKEGYNFSGWSEIPATMPAYDVTITGSFTKGAYKLTYMLDGVVYKTISYDYGDAITPEPAPTKEGYTFSGWSEIPETMPAHDVTVTGTFSINKYKLTYIVDGVEYKSYDIEYGATITPEAEPTKEGYTFSGWSEIPTTMPAHDVTVTGTFTLDTGIEEIMSNANGGVMIFTIDGKRVDNLKKGMNVIRMKDGTTRKVVVK